MKILTAIAVGVIIALGAIALGALVAIALLRLAGVGG